MYVYEGMVGLTIRTTVYVDGELGDLSTATVKQFIFSKPDDTTETVDCSFATDGTDGQLQYITPADFLSPPGMWSFQPYIEMGGAKFPCSPSSFNVKPNL